MKNNDVIKFFTACKDECKEETKEIRSIWENCLNQYLCKKDFGDKENWQFKVYTPISKPTIKKAVRLIKRVMVSGGDYFDFETANKDAPVQVSGLPQPTTKGKLCDLTKRALGVHLNAAKFIDQFAEALESGFTLSMMILKFWVAEQKEHFAVDADAGDLVFDTNLKLKVKAINPFNFWFSRDHQINIEDEWMTMPALKEIVENSVDDNGNSIYNKSVFKKLVSYDYGPPANIKDEDEDRLRRLGILKQQNDYRKEILLSHYWGPLIDAKNNVVMENCQFTVANEKHVILPPRENPFWHKGSPFVYGSPLNVLFRHIGKGLTEDVRGIEDAVVDFVNLQLDNLMWQMLGVREVDEMALTEHTKSDLRELYPGKLVRRRSGYQGNTFEFHELGVNPDKAMPMLQELKSLHEQEHGVTEYIRATPGQSATATEYSGKRQAAMGDFQSIALDIEKNFLTRCIDKARDLMIQFLADFESHPNISTIFQQEGLQIDLLNDDQKRAMIVTDTDIIGRGISIFFEREEKIDKLGSYVKFLNAMPEPAQLYPNWPEVLNRINDVYAFDKPFELIHTEEKVAQLKAEIQQQQQQQTMLQFKQMQEELKGDLMKISKEQEGKQAEISREQEGKQAEMRHESEENQKDRMLEIVKLFENERDRKKVSSGSK